MLLYIQCIYLGAQMRVTIKKWGNSAAVRIPSSIMDAAHIHLDDQVEIREKNGRIWLEPVRRSQFTLDELVSAITDENRHEPIDFGKPVGEESW